ncbi:MAG: hypothetical protein ACK40V_10260, partial [Anaerolineales bacterium]
MTENNSSDNMQNRINNLFTGSDLPAPASLKEMEAMRNRIQELEAKLKLEEQWANAAKEEAKQNQQMKNIASSSTPKAVSSTSKESWLTKFLNRFVEAHPSITEIRERNAARLSASFLIVIFLLEMVGILVQTSTRGLIGAMTGPIALAIFPTVLTYVVSRTRYYRAA